MRRRAWQQSKHPVGNGDGLVPARAPEIVSQDPNYRPTYEEDTADSGLLGYLRILRRYKGTLILFAFLGGVGGFLSTLPETPIYRASTTVEVQGLNQEFLNMGSYSPTANTSFYEPGADIATQVKIMSSDSLRNRAVEKMLKQPGPESTYPTDRLSAWKKALGLGSGEAMTREAAVANAVGSSDIESDGDTRIIQVSCESPDPRLAAEAANTLVSEFIEENLESRWETTERTGAYLTRQLEDLKIRLEQSEDELQGYATEAGLQYTVSDMSKEGSSESVAEERFRMLQTELMRVQAERMAAQSKYELVKSSPADALPQVLDDPSLRDYQSRLTELRRQMAELSTTLTVANPKVQRVQAQIDELESALARERANVVTRIRNDYEAAQRRERLLKVESDTQARLVSAQSARAIHYNILKREVDSTRELYQSMLQKVKEAGIASAMRASTFRVIDPAWPPGGPYKPQPQRTAMQWAMGGLLIGFVLVILRERADRTLQQPGDLSLYLNLPELGVIPAAKASIGGRSYGRSLAAPGTGEADGDRLELVTWRRKPSLLAESFRTTLTSILLSGENGTQPRVIAVTSAAPAEGKTTAATNLAIALAEINRRVLLIDADMRRPRIHHLFELKNDSGLTTLLEEKQPIVESRVPVLVQETAVPGLFVLSSGPPAVNASSLLHSPRLPELLNALREQFDTILIDTPPMLHLADARLLGRFCDTVILMVRAGKTSRNAAQAARQKLVEDGTPILGTILVDWNPGAHGVGYGGKYYYDSYSKYYSQQD